MQFCGIAQSGFSNVYDFGAQAAVFKNCILVGDTIIITGGILPSGSNQWSAMLARIDTNGQIIDIHYYPDTLGDHFVQVLNYGIIKDDQNDYLMMGTLYERNTGVLIKTDKDGNLIFYKEYSLGNDLTYRPRGILELADGYMIVGYKTRSNYHPDAHVMKVNKVGDIVWEKFYGDWELNEADYSLVMVDSNHFVISGSKGLSSGNSLNSYTKSSFWGVDSLGNLQWQWQSNPQNIESAALALQHLPDGGWLYCTRSFLAFGPQDWGGLCKIVRRDSNMNLVWQRTLMPQPMLTWEANNLWDIKPTPDGNWVAVGHWVPYYSEHPDSLPWQGGFLHKFSPEGDSIWTVLDTVFSHPVWGLDNRLGGAAVLPSGSVVAVGYANSYDGENFKSWAWVLKVDKDGCVDTLCTVVGSDEAPPLPETAGLRVFPNPASDRADFQWQAPHLGGMLTIADATGQIVFRSKLQAGQTKLEWDTAKTASGMYFYHWRAANGADAIGKILVSH
ncbi:MAG: T9SS C-terminal target domain-containing protein [Haliscomenobacteraceae bacterium CHB4]|nr:hypothetical protein [Saprospiraceae bacterium]MCE7924613.1 T9SS C-terminal target domain-containing protein [Haliscomenobacteraceae bacterium CHB4]